jgi:hypothetical protein
MKKITNKQKKKVEIKKEDTLKQFNFFMEIWRKRDHSSEISGKWLGKEPFSTFFHHILPKSKYPNARYEEDNIILLTLEEHERVENNPDYFEEINERRKKLMEKYA